MSLDTRRFGTLEPDPREILHLAGGLPPFAAEDYLLLTRAGEEPFAWLQALEEPDLAFLVVPAEAVGRAPDLSAADRLALGLESSQRPLALYLVTVSTPDDLTLNLLAPVLLNPLTGAGRQFLRDGDLADLQAPLRRLALAA